MSTNPLWKEAIAEAMVCATEAVILHTLELEHPAFPEVVRLVQDLQSHDLKLNDTDTSTVTFEAAGFRFSLPPSGSSGVQELMLQMDNTDQRISDYLELALSQPVPVTVRYRAYIYGDVVPQTVAPLTLYLSDLKVTAVEVSGRASFADVINRPFLSVPYSVRRFGGLA